MNKYTMCRAVALIVLLATTTLAGAHPATERYIPIGESPGVSGKTSYMTVIRELDDGRHLLEIRSTKGVSEVRMTDKTRIYLDRTATGKTNLEGSYADCRPGRQIEVKFFDNDPAKAAEWIKVRVTE